MQYLKTFQIPSDGWVNWYFTPWNTDIYPPPLDMPDPDNFIHPNKASFHNTWYPWNVFENRFVPSDKKYIVDILCPKFTFSDITIFYGGNGSGKSTLLNVIAQKLQVNRQSLFNTSPFFDDYVSVCECETDWHFNAAQRGRIIVSDEVFQKILETREANDETRKAREDMFEYLMACDHAEIPKHLDPNNPEEMKRYRDIAYIKSGGRNTVSRYVNQRLAKTAQEQSNGENAFHYFVEQITDDSLVLLDEPENSLSAMWQMELARFIQGAVREFNCQFIIASHSPFFLSMMGALIYDLDAMPIRTAQWYELESMQAYYQLFKSNEQDFLTKG